MEWEGAMNNADHTELLQQSPKFQNGDASELYKLAKNWCKEEK